MVTSAGPMLINKNSSDLKKVLLSGGQAELAEKAMHTMETELRKTLEIMGLTIGPETDAQTVHNMMELANIQVKHFTFEGRRNDESGYYFYHDRKLVTILFDPRFEKQPGGFVKIKIARGVMR